MACSRSLSSGRGSSLLSDSSLTGAAGKPLRLPWSSHHFGHEIGYECLQVVAGGACNSPLHSLPIGKVHLIFPSGCNIIAKIKEINCYTNNGNIDNSVLECNTLEFTMSLPVAFLTLHFKKGTNVLVDLLVILTRILEQQFVQQIKNSFH